MKVYYSDIVAFSTSNGEIPAHKFGGTSLSNSHTSVSTLFPCPLELFRILPLLFHQLNTLPRKYFNPSSRALRTACNGNSLPVMSSKHVASCSCSSSTSYNIACLLRLRLARPFMIDLQFLFGLAPHLRVNLQFSRPSSPHPLFHF